MADQTQENIEFDGLRVPIRRQATHELYIALQPPDAIPYIVAPLDKKPEEIVEFISAWIEPIRELRVDMIKRYEKSKSTKCHYQTGDVAYMFGRPFMLKVYPLGKRKRVNKAMRGRTNIKATVRPEISVIDLFVAKTGDYDQGHQAFLAFAKPILVRNSKHMIETCRDRTFPGIELPKNVRCRPMRDDWVKIEEKTNTVWFSDRLIPYPADCSAYAFLVELIKIHAPDADEEERHEILEKGVPGWKRIREILNDPESVYTQQ